MSVFHTRLFGLGGLGAWFVFVFPAAYSTHTHRVLVHSSSFLIPVPFTKNTLISHPVYMVKFFLCFDPNSYPLRTRTLLPQGSIVYMAAQWAFQGIRLLSYSVSLRRLSCPWGAEPYLLHPSVPHSPCHRASLSGHSKLFVKWNKFESLAPASRVNALFKQLPWISQVTCQKSTKHSLSIHIRHPMALTHEHGVGDKMWEWINRKLIPRTLTSLWVAQPSGRVREGGKRPSLRLI